MPGLVLHFGAVTQCSHAAPATPLVPNVRVKVSAMPVVNVGTPHVVVGCPFTGTGGACTSGQWVIGALRVTSMGQPLAIQGGFGQCIPNGMPMATTTAQPRVFAS